MLIGPEITLQVHGFIENLIYLLYKCTKRRNNRIQIFILIQNTKLFIVFQILKFVRKNKHIMGMIHLE